MSEFDMTTKIYLAGPDVFFPDSQAHFAALEAKCRAHGCVGIRPSEGDMELGGTGDEIAERIYQANIELLCQCDAVLANLTPFRNALESDSGTVFEVGFAVALGKPVAGHLPQRDQTHESKVTAVCGITRDARGVAWDAAHGYLVEEFGQPVNLMVSRAAELFSNVDDAIAYLAKVTSARQAEFPDRGQRSLDEAKRTGVYVPAEEVIARLQRKLDDATSRFLEQRVPAPLMAAAIEVFGGESTAVEWFMKPAMGLDRARPIDLLGSPEGMQAVRDFLARLDGGVYT